MGAWKTEKKRMVRVNRGGEVRHNLHSMLESAVTAPPLVGCVVWSQQSTTHGNAPKGSGSYLRPKTHIHNISVQAHKPLQIIKTLTATGWGKQKETLMATYKAVMRPALEYASSVWSPIASSTSINKLQVMQNAALRTATGCTRHKHTTSA